MPDLMDEIWAEIAKGDKPPPGQMQADVQARVVPARRAEANVQVGPDELADQIDKEVAKFFEGQRFDALNASARDAGVSQSYHTKSGTWEDFKEDQFKRYKDHFGEEIDRDRWQSEQRLWRTAHEFVSQTGLGNSESIVERIPTKDRERFMHMVADLGRQYGRHRDLPKGWLGKPVRLGLEALHGTFEMAGDLGAFFRAAAPFVDAEQVHRDHGDYKKAKAILSAVDPLTPLSRRVKRVGVGTPLLQLLHEWKIPDVVRNAYEKEGLAGVRDVMLEYADLGSAGAARMAPALVGGASMTAGKLGRVGGVGFWYALSQPDLYQYLREEGKVSHQGSMIGSHLLALPYAIVGQWQQEGIVGMSKPLLNKARSEGVKRAVEVMGRGVGTWATETGEEALQEAIKYVGVNTVAAAEGKISEVDQWKVLNDAVESVGQAAISMPFLLAPGGAVNLMRGEMGEADQKMVQDLVAGSSTGTSADPLKSLNNKGFLLSSEGAELFSTIYGDQAGKIMDNFRPSRTFIERSAPGNLPLHKILVSGRERELFASLLRDHAAMQSERGPELAEDGIRKFITEQPELAIGMLQQARDPNRRHLAIRAANRRGFDLKNRDQLRAFDRLVRETLSGEPAAPTPTEPALDPAAAQPTAAPPMEAPVEPELTEEESLARLAEMEAEARYEVPEEVDEAQEEPTVAQGAEVPFMITKNMKRELADLNWSDAQIGKMKPKEAWEIINAKKYGDSPGADDFLGKVAAEKPAAPAKKRIEKPHVVKRAEKLNELLDQELSPEEEAAEIAAIAKDGGVGGKPVTPATVKKQLRKLRAAREAKGEPKTLKKKKAEKKKPAAKKKPPEKPAAKKKKKAKKPPTKAEAKPKLTEGEKNALVALEANPLEDHSDIITEISDLFEKGLVREDFTLTKAGQKVLRDLPGRRVGEGMSAIDRELGKSPSPETFGEDIKKISTPEYSGQFKRDRVAWRGMSEKELQEGLSKGEFPGRGGAYFASWPRKAWLFAKRSTGDGVLVEFSQVVLEGERGRKTPKTADVVAVWRVDAGGRTTRVRGEDLFAARKPPTKAEPPKTLKKAKAKAKPAAKAEPPKKAEEPPIEEKAEEPAEPPLKTLTKKLAEPETRGVEAALESEPNLAERALAGDESAIKELAKMAGKTVAAVKKALAREADKPARIKVLEDIVREKQEAGVEVFTLRGTLSKADIERVQKAGDSKISFESTDKTGIEDLWRQVIDEMDLPRRSRKKIYKAEEVTAERFEEAPEDWQVELYEKAQEIVPRIMMKDYGLDPEEASSFAGDLFMIASTRYSDYDPKYGVAQFLRMVTREIAIEQYRTKPEGLKNQQGIPADAQISRDRRVEERQFDGDPLPDDELLGGESPQKTESSWKIIEGMARAFGFKLEHGRVPVLGQFNDHQSIMDMGPGMDDSLKIATHELGHFIHAFTNLVDNMSDAVKAELRTLDNKPQRGWLTEGVAEWFRLALTTDTAKAKAPLMWEHYSRWDDGRGTKKKIRDLRVKINTWRKAGGHQRVAASMSPEKTVDTSPRTKLGKFMMGARKALDDQFAASQEAWEKWKKITGAKEITAELDVMSLLRTVAAQPMHLFERAWEDGIYSMVDEGRRISGSLEQILNMLPARKLADGFRFAYARHARDVWKSGRNPGINQADAEQVYQDLKNQTDIKEFADAFTSFHKALVQMYGELGGLKQKEVDAILTSYPYYVPLKRVQDATEIAQNAGFGNLRHPFMRMSDAGSGRDIVHPLISTVDMMMSLSGKATKQMVLNAWGTMAKEGAKFGPWVEIRPAKGVNINEIRGALRDSGSSPTDNLLNWMYDGTFQPGGSREMLGRINGEDYLITLNEELYAELVGNNNAAHMMKFLTANYPKSMSALMAATQVKKTLTTGVRPSFIFFTNLINDPLLGAIQSRMKGIGTRGSLIRRATEGGVVGDILGPINFITSVIFADIKAMVDLAVKPFGMVAIKDPVYRGTQTIAKHFGGKFSQFIAQGVDRAGPKLKKVMNNPEMRAEHGISMTFGELFMKLVSPITYLPKTAYKTLETISSELEAAPRNVEFREHLLDQGVNIAEVAKAIQDGEALGIETVYKIRKAMESRAKVSINFNRGGHWMKAFNKTESYSNSQWQGISQPFEKFRENKTRFLIRSMVAISIPTALMWAAYKDEEWYKEMPPWLKYFFWHIPSRNEKGDVEILRIPRSHELGWVFGGSLHATLDMAYDKNPEAMGEWARSILPADSQGEEFWTSLGLGLGNKVLDRILPDLLQPGLEGVINYDLWRGQNIIGARSGLAGLESEDQMFLFNSATSKYLGEMFTASPAKIDHAIRNYTGGFYNEVDRGLQEEGVTAKIIGIGGLGRNLKQTTKGHTVSEFYDEKGRLQKKVNSARLRGEVPKDLAERSARFNEIGKIMTTIRKSAKDLRMVDAQHLMKYVTGLARWGMGKDELSTYPNPIMARGPMPKIVRETRDDYLATKLWNASGLKKHKDLKVLREVKLPFHEVARLLMRRHRQMIKKAKEEGRKPPRINLRLKFLRLKGRL